MSTSTRDIGNGRTIIVTDALWDRWTAMTPNEQRAFFATATRDELLNLVWHFERETTETFSTKEFADYCVHLAGYTDMADGELRERVREYGERFPGDDDDLRLREPAPAHRFGSVPFACDTGTYASYNRCSSPPIPSNSDSMAVMASVTSLGKSAPLTAAARLFPMRGGRNRIIASSARRRRRPRKMSTRVRSQDPGPAPFDVTPRSWPADIVGPRDRQWRRPIAERRGP